MNLAEATHAFISSGESGKGELAAFEAGFVAAAAPPSDWAPEVAQAYALIVERLRLRDTPHDATWAALLVVQTALRGIGPRDRLDGPQHERIAQGHTRAHVVADPFGDGRRPDLVAPPMAGEDMTPRTAIRTLRYDTDALAFANTREALAYIEEQLQRAQAEQESWDTINNFARAKGETIGVRFLLNGNTRSHITLFARGEYLMKPGYLTADSRAEALTKAAEWCEANK